MPAPMVTPSPYSTALVSVSVRFSAISGGAAGGDISLAAGWLDLLLMGPGLRASGIADEALPQLGRFSVDLRPAHPPSRAPPPASGRRKRTAFVGLRVGWKRWAS